MPAFRMFDNFRVFLTTVRSAAVLTAKQVQLARIRELSLPSIYSAIGRHLMSLQTLPQDLSEAHDAVRSIEKSLACQPKAGCEAGHEGTSSEAKTWVGKTFQRLAKASANATASVKLQRAYETLGRNAVDRPDREAVPEALASQLATTRNQEAELRESITSLQQAGITVVSQITCLGVLLFAMAWLLPALAAPPGLMFMVSALRESLSYSPPAAVLLLGMNGLLICVMFLACSSRQITTTANRVLIGLLGACAALILWWMFSAWREVTFLAGFYAWLACFAVFGLAMWLRNRKSFTESRFQNACERSLSVPGLVAAALACYLLGSVLPVSGASNVYGWGAFRSFASGGGYWMTVASKATNLVALAAFITLLTHQRLSTLALSVLFAGCVVCGLVNVPYVLFEPDLRAGFFLWVASFCLLAVHAGRELIRRRTAGVGSCLIQDGMTRFATAGVLGGLLLGLPMISGASQAIIGSFAPASSVAQTTNPVSRNPAPEQSFSWSDEVDKWNASRGTPPVKNMPSGGRAPGHDVLNEQNLEGIAAGRIPADDATRRRAIAIIRERAVAAVNSLAAGDSHAPDDESTRRGDLQSPNRRVFTDDEWTAITASLVREGRVQRSRPQDAAKYFGVYAAIKKVFVDSGIQSPSIRMLNGFKGQVCEATITARGPEAAAQKLTELVLAAKQSGIPLVTVESAAQFESGAMPGAVPGADGLASQRQGGGYAPQGVQQFEGTCTKCGYRTGRQVNQSQRTCSQLGVGADGTRPCGGVIVWAAAGAMPGAPGMMPPQQDGMFPPNGMQQFEGTCTKCGYRTGRQVNQTQRTCSQLGVGVDGTRPCGGVIAWAPAGQMPGAVPGTDGLGPARQGDGYRPQPMQQFEGRCSRCGYRTGRQVNQSQRTCSQLGVGADGTRPCGGVIVWGPAQGF